MKALWSSASTLEEQGHVARSWGAQLGHGHYAQAHVALWGISPSTWRATVWPAWEAFFGELRVELDLGPKSKVEAHELIYISH